jgi:hypothetical protein
MTVLELYSDALAWVGAIQPGMTPSGTTTAVARRAHTDMMRSWSEIRLRQAFVPEVQYPLTPGLGVYEIGPGAAQFDTTPGVYVRPIFIQSAQVLVGTARRWDLNILTRPQWEVNQTKTLTDPDGPLDFFYDFNHPKATFNVGPKPGNAQTMFVSQWNPLHIFAEGDEALNVEDFYPDAYIVAMKYGLVLQLSPPYRFPITQDLLGLFQSSIAIIENKNREKLTGAFGSSRTLQTPTKGDDNPMGVVPMQAQQQQQ